MPLVLALLTAIVAPATLAYQTNTPLDLPVRVISTLFNIPSLRNPAVQLGFVRFGIWLVIFSLGFYGLQQVFKNEGGRKTAGILSAVIAAIGAWFMPQEWVLAEGGLIVAIVSSAIIIGIVLGFLVAITKLSQSEFFLFRLLSVIIALLGIAIINILANLTGSSLRGIGLLLVPGLASSPLQACAPKRARTRGGR